MPTRFPMNVQQRCGVAAILLIALIAGLFVWCIDGYGFEPRDDSRQYHNIAVNLAERGIISMDGQPPYEPDARRVPGYPMFLAAIYSFVGPNVTLAKFIQTAFVPLWVLLTFLIGYRVSRKRGAVFAAAAIVLITPVLLEMSNRLLTEGLFTVLLLTGTLTSYLWADTSQFRWAAVTGMCWASLGLIKPEAILLPAAVIPFVLINTREFRTARLAQCVVALMICGTFIGVWVYRNNNVVGRPCLISGSGDGSGPSLLRQYRLRAENGFTFMPERYTFLYPNDWKERQAAFDAAMDGPVHNPDESDVECWLHRPMLTAQYTLVRFAGLMRPVSSSRTFGLDRDFTQLRGGSSLLPLAGKAGMLMLDVLGVLLSVLGVCWSLHPSNRRLWIITATIAYFVTVYSLLHGITRYRVPLMPLGILLGCLCIASIACRFRNRSNSNTSPTTSQPPAPEAPAAT
ncbi:MAG: ArnT family glycosyltransferase [Maioricimonas sp. JB049]